MVFITVYYAKKIINTLTIKKHWPNISSIKLLIGLCLTAFHLTFSTMSAAFERGHNADSGYNEFQLSDEIKGAVDSGIVLSFECELKTNKELFFIPWPKQKRNHTFTLTYNSLSNSYLVRVDGSERPKNFHSIGEASDFIIEQSMTFFSLYSSNKNNTQMRLSLNRYKLPGPIRLNAFIADHWNIDTDWISWIPES